MFELDVLILIYKAFKQRMDDMSTQLDDLKTAVANAASEMHGAGEQVKQLKADNAALKAQVADLQDQIAHIPPSGDDPTLLVDPTATLNAATDALKAAEQS